MTLNSVERIKESEGNLNAHKSERLMRVVWIGLALILIGLAVGSSTVGTIGLMMVAVGFILSRRNVQNKN